MYPLFILSAYLAFNGGVEAVADCTAYSNSCAKSCQSILNKQSNYTCNEFSLSCQCASAGSSNPSKSQGEEYCAQQKSNCESSGCNGSPLDSFSCDPYSFSSQCLCKSGSSMSGGPIMGSNETQCASLIQKCNEETCKGKKVEKNTCVNPLTAVCKCEGDNPGGAGFINAATVSSGILSSISVATIFMLSAL